MTGKSLDTVIACALLCACPGDRATEVKDCD
jgi:hypothetical protein